MATRLPFVCLPNNERVGVRVMFFDACDSDGYLYEVDPDGHELCRKRLTSDWIEGAPPESIDYAWLRVLTRTECDGGAAHVILGVFDSDGLWCKSGDYNGESTIDVVPKTITHLMPHAVPRARIGA